MLPVRKIKNHSGKNIGKFPSKKMGRAIGYESLLEADMILHLESDQDVLSFCEQPETIMYFMKGKRHRYTPDFNVKWRSGKSQIIEVKPYEKTKKAEFKTLIRNVGPIFQEHGEEFVVITEKTIRNQPRLENLKILHRYSRASVTMQDQIELNAFLSKKGTATVAELETALSHKGITVLKIFNFIYKGFLSVNLDETLCPTSIVTLKGGYK